MGRFIRLARHGEPKLKEESGADAVSPSPRSGRQLLSALARVVEPAETELRPRVLLLLGTAKQPGGEPQLASSARYTDVRARYRDALQSQWRRCRMRPLYLPSALAFFSLKLCNLLAIVSTTAIYK